MNRLSAFPMSLLLLALSIAADCNNHSNSLRELYFNNNGAGWINSSGWLSNLPLGQWHGVVADANGCGKEINLTSNNLTGILPLGLTQISSLSAIILPGNQLTGTIPVAYQNLRLLTTLSLENNNLSGALWSFPLMYSLSLSNNNFTGTLPPQYFRVMPELRRVLINNNQLSGTFPDVSSNSFVEVLNGQANNFTGPLPSVNCTLLQQLRLSINQFTGSIPNWIQTCKVLLSLSLSSNQLSGTIPHFSFPSALQSIALGGNNFTGTLPPGFFKQMPDLMACGLENNKLSGIFPDLSLNSKLQVFFAERNRFVGPLPSLNSTVLMKVGLSNNQFTGTLPQWVHNNKSLQLLDISNNALRGDFPLLSSGTLQTLQIQGNNFTGDILHLISHLPNLTKLYASRNKFTLSHETRSVSIAHKTLHLLQIDGNHFTAEIESIRLNKQSLQIIILSGNTLYCPLPLAASRIRGSDLFVTDRCVIDWTAVLILILPGVVLGIVGLCIRARFKPAIPCQFLLKVVMGQVFLALNYHTLVSYFQLLTPDINVNCEKANSFAVFSQYLSVPVDLNDSTQMTFSTFISRKLVSTSSPQAREESLTAFQGLCRRLGGTHATCQYDDKKQECEFNGDSHVQYTLGVKEIIIILMVLLTLQQLIATVLVIVELRNPSSTRVNNNPDNSLNLQNNNNDNDHDHDIINNDHDHDIINNDHMVRRHLSYSSVFAFLLLLRPTYDKKDLGARLLIIDFLQGVVLKGGLLILNVWVATRIQQTGLSAFQIVTALFNTVYTFIPLVRALGLCFGKAGSVP